MNVACLLRNLHGNTNVDEYRHQAWIDDVSFKAPFQKVPMLADNLKGREQRVLRVLDQGSAARAHLGNVKDGDVGRPFYLEQEFASIRSLADFLARHAPMRP